MLLLAEFAACCMAATSAARCALRSLEQAASAPHWRSPDALITHLLLAGVSPRIHLILLASAAAVIVAPFAAFYSSICSSILALFIDLHYSSIFCGRFCFAVPTLLCAADSALHSRLCFAQPTLLCAAGYALPTLPGATDSALSGTLCLGPPTLCLAMPTLCLAQPTVLCAADFAWRQTPPLCTAYHSTHREIVVKSEVYTDYLAKPVHI